MNKTDILYVYVGNNGGSFNGVGNGGGATDIRLIDGAWNNFNSLKSRIMVAAGGGGPQDYYDGYDYRCPGGYAGGLTGGSASTKHYPSGTYISSGAAQTSGGICSSYPAWKGGFGYVADSGHGRGGMGYYGGGSGPYMDCLCGAGSGGSSFISGHSGCNAINESSTDKFNMSHRGISTHYSGKIFTNTQMIAGNATQTKPGGGTETGHSGSGYCRIIMTRSL
ncbi:Glycine rich protein [Prevotellaceae bacterium MN60]|nr:Glycine rich protein [Prevotellaceae bacterium MN60]